MIMDLATGSKGDGPSMMSACPVDGQGEPLEAERLGVIIRLDRSPDGNPDRDLIHIADGQGGLLILPVSGVCPCLDALLNIVGHRVSELPDSVRTVYGYCRDNQYKLCPRFPALCTRPAYLEHLRQHLEKNPTIRDLLTDLPL